MQYVVMDALAPTTELASVSRHQVATRNVAELDAATFQRVYEGFRLSIHRYVVARIGPAAAEDVTAEVFVAAWRSRTRYDASRHDGNVEPWLMGIATKIVSRHRASERRWLEACRAGSILPSEDADEVEGVETRLDATTLHRQLVAALAHLPARERLPLVMHIVSGMEYEAIATSLGIPVGTVRSRISRGRTRLLERIDSRGAER